MRVTNQVVEIERADGDLSRHVYRARLFASYGEATIQWDVYLDTRRSKRCKNWDRAFALAVIPPDVLAEARVRFCKMIDEMLEGRG